MSSAPDPLADATARREATQAAEFAAHERWVHAPRGLTPTQLADLERAWREAQQRLIAACDVENRTREGGR